MAPRNPAPRTAKPDEPQPDTVEEEQDEITTPSSLGFVQQQREIEVDPIQPLPEQKPGDDDTVEVRMAVTIEEFTYGNPHVHTKLEEGHRYRMPVYIAQYLQRLGKLSNIA